MRLRYPDIVVSFRDALVSALKAAAPHFKDWPVDRSGTRDISAMSLDRFVQFGYVQVSFRRREERETGGDIGSWANQGYLSSKDGPCDEELAPIVSTSKQFMTSADGAAKDLRHVLFLAAAEALLDPQVATLLQGHEVDAPDFGDSLGGYPFTFYVMDPDEALRVNYCDVIRANRVTARVISRQ